MEADQVLRRLGSVATWAQLWAVLPRAAIESALADGRIARVGQGLYALPAADAARVAARRVNGVVSHLSAALYWDLPVKLPPERPVVTVPRRRRLGADRRQGVDVRWRDLGPSDVYRGEATLPAPTVVDCARALPFDEALAVPQVFLPGVGRPDLVDRHLGIVVECDSFGFHAERTDLARDCRRYHACAVRDLAVVRFTWEDGMSDPDYVVRTLTDLVRVRTGRRAVRRRGDVLPA